MADFFQWDDAKFKFNIQLIDSEHKELMKLMNNLYEKNQSKASVAELDLALAQLAQFTVKHFQDEENYFDSIKFPGAESHKLIHKQMLTKIQDYANEFKKTSVLTPDFFNFLKLWLGSHILGIDAKYADHAKSKKAA